MTCQVLRLGTKRKLFQRSFIFQRRPFRGSGVQLHDSTLPSTRKPHLPFRKWCNLWAAAALLLQAQEMDHIITDIPINWCITAFSNFICIKALFARGNGSRSPNNVSKGIVARALLVAPDFYFLKPFDSPCPYPWTLSLAKHLHCVYQTVWCNILWNPRVGTAMTQANREPYAAWDVL